MQGKNNKFNILFLLVALPGASLDTNPSAADALNWKFSITFVQIN